MKSSRIIYNLAILISATSLIVSCEDPYPEITFSQPIKGKQVNLAHHLGNQFEIERDSVRVKYNIAFDQTNKTNWIIKEESDTIFKGTVTKRNRLFLLNRQLDDGKYSISALTFNYEYITGLETEWLQSTIIKNMLAKGLYQNSVTSKSDISTSLNVEPKEGRKLFNFVLDQLEKEHIFHPENTQTISNTLDETYNPVRSIYPNPFTSHITIDLTEEAAYEFQVYSLQGNLLHKSEINTQNIKLDLSQLPQGKYIIRVINTELHIMHEEKIIKN